MNLLPEEDRRGVLPPLVSATVGCLEGHSAPGSRTVDLMKVLVLQSGERSGPGQKLPVQRIEGRWWDEGRQALSHAIVQFIPAGRLSAFERRGVAQRVYDLGVDGNRREHPEGAKKGESQHTGLRGRGVAIQSMRQ